MGNAKKTSNRLHRSAAPGWKTLLAAAAVCAGAAPVMAQNCTDINPSDYKKVVLASGLDSPMKLAIAKDGRVFFNQRSGKIRMIKPGDPKVVDLLTIKVQNGGSNEDGLLGIALDPKFESNQFLYAFYAASTTSDYKISRFTLTGETLGNEKVLLSIPHPYTPTGDVIIHGAGGMAFDPSGNLLVGTGDLMITTGSGAPTPTNQNQVNYDAGKTSANSNSLLGKILRIKPTDAGGYTIPNGNLFPPGTAKTLPEIYAMGARNPFTITVDPQTGWAYFGEVGPDGTGGPIPSQDEVNQIKAAGNFGWPYLTGDNQAYTGFSADKPVNNSKNNTGITDLPAPTKSLFWMGMMNSWPIDGFVPKNKNVGGRCIKIGGFYRFNPAGTNPARLPPYFDNGLFVANHNQIDSADGIRFFKLNETGGLAAIKVFQNTSRLPMAFEIGPDGVLYMVEWGKDNGHWFNQVDGRILRIDYTGNCSSTGIVNREIPEARSFGKVQSIYPGQVLEYPSGAVSADIYDLSGKKIFNLRKDQVSQTDIHMLTHQDGILLAKFRGE
jgi:glucose/arabinose dehydrogenase